MKTNKVCEECEFNRTDLVNGCALYNGFNCRLVEKMKHTSNCIHGTNSNICSLLNLNNPRCEGCTEWELK